MNCPVIHSHLLWTNLETLCRLHTYSIFTTTVLHVQYICTVHTLYIHTLPRPVYVRRIGNTNTHFHPYYIQYILYIYLYLYTTVRSTIPESYCIYSTVHTAPYLYSTVRYFIFYNTNRARKCAKPSHERSSIS
jgi:hypothetical protein